MDQLIFVEMQLAFGHTTQRGVVDLVPLQADFHCKYILNFAMN